MNILGIDLSLQGTGLARLDEDISAPTHSLDGKFLRKHQVVGELWDAKYYTGWLLSPVPKNKFERLEKINEACMDAAYGAHLIVMEGYSFGSFSAQLHAIHELGGVVFYHLAKHFPSATIVTVPPLVLKKFITGSGGADKNQVLKEIYKRYGVDLNDDNMADAFGLAKFGQAMISTEGLPQFQIDVVYAFKNPVEKKKKRAKDLMHA